MSGDDRQKMVLLCLRLAAEARNNAADEINIDVKAGILRIAIAWEVLAVSSDTDEIFGAMIEKLGQSEN